ncbi:hypothetical protein ElyMa_006847800 [Elysia marginata]|uniref:Uncharacterized protein n=1 Tax=Elysia marginata TaxID=1093978 RepID=A0AAV4J7S1_9GAST|nr:hypothetical protein ElyMa_006847800 [Elysia marginata]
MDGIDPNFSLDVDLGLNIGFDTDFQTLLESSNATTTNQQQQDSSASCSSVCSNCFKLREVDAQAKTMLSLKRQLESANRDSSILSEQLKTAMEDMKPLKEDKKELESALREKSSEVESLTDRLYAEEAIRNQRSGVVQRNKELETEKLNLEKKIRCLETRNKSLQSSVQNLEGLAAVTGQGQRTSSGSNGGRGGLHFVA